MKSKNNNHSSADFALLQAFLLKKGLSLGQIKQLIGTKTTDMTRDQISQAIIAYCQNLPKG